MSKCITICPCCDYKLIFDTADEGKDIICNACGKLFMAENEGDL